MLTMPSCHECVHFFEESEGMCCRAYPEGIPHKILYESGMGDWDGKCSKNYKFKENNDTTGQ